MGNTVPQRRCREAGTAAGAEGKNSKNVAGVEAPAAPRRAAVTQRDNEEREEEVMTRTGRRRAGGGDGSPAGTVVTVKIVMSRKDAGTLVARLRTQSARERKARMAELKRELRAGDGASPVPCRDAWRPRLAPVQENQSAYRWFECRRYTCSGKSY